MTPEELDEAKARDARFAAIDLGLEVQAALRKGSPLRAVMDALRGDADAAMVAFAEVNPADMAAVIGLQARVRCFTFAFRTFQEIIARGQVAEHSLQSEHEADLNGPE